MLYTPGDVLRVYPENDEQKVDELITILNWNDKKDTLFRIEDNQTRDGDIIVDTLRNVLLRFTEPLSVPRDRYFFELLSHFAVEEIHKQKLAEFGSSEGQEAMYEYCWRAKRTAFEIIKDFLPLKIPVEYAVELFSFMKGRDFSISSAPLNSNSLDVTVGVVEYKTILKDGRFGVCTPWLCRTLPLGQPFAGEIIKGQLRCMADANEPVIYIAAGLGIAPIRSIVQDRISKGCDKNVLFFGCRYRSKDYLYENEWNDYVSEGKLKLYCAFSRDGLSKVYVQHLMRENGSEIWELINSHNAHILLCGNSKNFPDDVDNALKTIFKTYGGYSQEDANLFLSKLIRSGRYQKETWSSK
jgi:sulfite reductase alpha subunit-like flavoprotein